jgi:L-ascorbate metabolism protein UlaG (beta-lactamase superfamily)
MMTLPAGSGKQANTAAPRKPNGRFQNLVPRRHGWGDALRWMVTRHAGKWHPQRDAQPGSPPPRSSDRLRITFVNHASFLLQLYGINILTDPIWSERASSVTWAGPRRFRPPGIRFEDLPPIHLVLLSHDHYDHMDLPTLQRLASQRHPIVYTGLKNAAYLAKHGIGNVIELDWWQMASTSGLRITAVPAQHFSGRTLFDRDKRLWCGFVVEAGEACIYFAGDTGAGPHIEATAQHFPNIDLAILPIGAYLPEWFMGEVHMSPGEAVTAHMTLDARVSVGCHFGTFALADDGEDQPLEDLQRALQHTNLRGTEFWTLGSGEGRDVPVRLPLDRPGEITAD